MRGTEAKLCYKCGVEKPLTDFYYSKSKGKHTSPCKVCRGQTAAAYAKSDRLRTRAYDRRAAQKPRQRFLRASRAARLRGHSWELTFEEYDDKIKNPCHYCGGPISRYGSGLDRRDNAPRYTRDNTVPCCAVCNRVKSNFVTLAEVLSARTDQK